MNRLLDSRRLRPNSADRVRRSRRVHRTEWFRVRRDDPYQMDRPVVHDVLDVPVVRVPAAAVGRAEARDQVVAPLDHPADRRRLNTVDLTLEPRRWWLIP